MKQKKFELTGKEASLAVVIAVLGFLFTTRQWILWLNSLSPFAGLIVYYIILYTSLYVLSRLGLTVFGIKIADKVETLGLLLITFAFFITVDWESSYIQYVTNGSLTGMSNVYLQAEDGAVWFLWSQLTQNIEALRILTYMVTPFVLALIGGLLVTGKIKID